MPSKPTGDDTGHRPHGVRQDGVALYTGLNILNTSEVNISTAEDPVEINLPGVNQVQINPRRGSPSPVPCAPSCARDPDIVMVGEIRDLETAEIAIKAASNRPPGALTLHTNSAAETLTRMMNIGVPAFNIASSVTLIMAQRLTRKLCDHCKAPEVVPEAELLELGFTQQQLAAGFACSNPWGARSAREATEGGSGSMRSC